MKTEREIEDNFIKKLEDLKYIYRKDIRDISSLEKNFREHFERLNKVKLTDSEFARLIDQIVTSDVFSASKGLRQINTFQREDDSSLQYTLVNIKEWCKNEFEVVNQVRINTRESFHRYDAIILMNGIPVVQIELKSLQIVPKKAMEQIVEYKNDPGNGYTNSLFCFIQLFIVSNEVSTYYFANNHKDHFGFQADEKFLPIYQLANDKNKKISHLHDFSQDFLSKCTLAQMISRYMVLVASEKKLMIMRPYQIYAVKAIVDCIHQNRGNGYIWHTTGSGKTLTSFKASTLLKDNPDIEKCLFVVDRKDLDRQTREEFNKFQEGCVEENTNTESLVQRLLSTDYADKVIVTTIQKLGLALDENSKRNQKKVEKGKDTYKKRLEPLRNKRIVIIFDECHRSQFGENHEAIKNFFPNAQLFGFTGTPIFEENATYKMIDGTQETFKTTQDIFQKLLHSYTITNAIDDENVLKFHIDYFKPEIKESEKTEKKKVVSNDEITQRAIVESILDKHSSATNQRKFNAIFATSSINQAIEYYEIFKEMQEQRKKDNPDYTLLNIVTVFSPPAEGNQDVQQIQEDLPQEKTDNEIDPDKKKKALEKIISDFNKHYRTNHKISDFDLYYQDIQQRIKDQKYSNRDYPHKNKIDIVIVVDMLLTGFDSKYLNTLYVDKNLKYHGLIQAFSRTNRVLNGTKPYGNILNFRLRERDVDEAIALFSGQDNNRAKEIWIVDPAEKVIEKLDEAISNLETFMKSKGLECKPSEVNNLKGDHARGEFITRFKEIQKLKTQLDQYTDITEEEHKKIDSRIPQDTFRGFRSMYIQTAEKLKETKDECDEKVNSLLEQLDFEFVLFSSAIIDYDYIMSLIAKFTHGTPYKQKTGRQELVNILSSYANLREEKDDILSYVDTLKSGQVMSEQDIHNGYLKFKSDKVHQELIDIAKSFELSPEAVQEFNQEILDRMLFDAERLNALFEPLDLGWKERSREEQKFMKVFIPLLKKLSGDRDIPGLNAYE